MGSAQDEKKKEATKRGAIAAAATAGSVAVAVAGGPVTLVAAGLGASAVLGYRWVKYRIDNSLRF